MILGKSDEGPNSVVVVRGVGVITPTFSSHKTHEVRAFLWSNSIIFLRVMFVIRGRVCLPLMCKLNILRLFWKGNEIH